MFDALQLDWFAFTFRPENPQRFYIELCKKYHIAPICDYDLDADVDLPRLINMFWLAFPELEPIACECEVVPSSMHYPLCMQNPDKIRIHFCDEKSSDDLEYNVLGVNVQVSSSALEAFMGYFGLDIDDVDMLKLMDIISSRGCHLSRLDLCVDDYSRKYSPAWYSYMCKDVFDYSTHSIIPNSRQVRSRMKNFWDIKGETFYCGDRKRGKILRIYDKNVESGGLENCIRYEFELHGHFAEEFIAYYLYGIGKNGVHIDRNENPFSFCEYFLNNWFEIIDRKLGDTNTQRCAIDKDWLDFMNELSLNLTRRCERSDKKKRVPVKVKHYTDLELLNRKANWIKRQCSNSFSILAKYYGLQWAESIISRDVAKEIDWLHRHHSFIDDIPEFYDFYDALYDR